MGEQIGTVMVRLSDMLHWLGKYEESNICAAFARFARASDVTTLEELAALVDKAESQMAPAQWDDEDAALAGERQEEQ